MPKIDSGTTFVRKWKRLGYLSAAPRVSTCSNAEASGPRSHVLGVIRAFRDLGWEVFPYIVGDRIPKTLTHQSGMRLEKSCLTRLAADIVRLFSGPFHSIIAWCELHGKIDFVYERFAVLQTLGWIFQYGKTPWILETSGLYYYEASIERKSIVLIYFARLIEIWAYRRCDVLVCVTDALKELIIRETGITAGKILVVPNGVDCTHFDPTKVTPKRPFSGPTIGFAGALLRWHRLDILLDALGELEQEGVQFNLVVAGDGPMRTDWGNRSKELGIEERTLFLGQKSWDEIPAYLAGFDLGYLGNNLMDIGVMYHSPLKLYEYMAMSLPVIAAENADSREMILPGEIGYLFKPGDKDDLMRVLRTVYAEKENWKKLGNRAREMVIRQASWHVRVKTMMDGIERILEER